MLYIYDLATADAQAISDRPAGQPRCDVDRFNTIYYNSDKDGKFNLYAYDTGTKKRAQITRTEIGTSAGRARITQGRIVYERDGELEMLDVGGKKAQELSITVPDDGIYKRSRISVAGLITLYSLSPKGERAVFAARGDI